jgi:hypothetical protein
MAVIKFFSRATGIQNGRLLNCFPRATGIQNGRSLNCFPALQAYKMAAIKLFPAQQEYNHNLSRSNLAGGFSH